MNDRGRYVMIGAAVGALVGAVAGFIASHVEQEGDLARLPAAAKSLDRQRLTRLGMSVVAVVRQIMDLG